jgi:hypothetical protein
MVGYNERCFRKIVYTITPPIQHYIGKPAQTKIKWLKTKNKGVVIYNIMIMYTKCERKHCIWRLTKESAEN